MQQKRRWSIFLALVVFGLIIASMAVVVRAQTGQKMTVTAKQSGHGFTFQGQLKDNGSSVNGTCDVRASLWDTAEEGSQIGESQTVKDVEVADGRFTIMLNAGDEFGATAFSGQERWLEVSVRCPAGSGSFSTLQPRQLLTAAPYAQGLVPGTRMESDYVGLWGLQIAMSSPEAHGAIYTKMGDVIKTGFQAGIRSDSTFQGIPAILGQSNQAGTAGIEGWSKNSEME